MFNKKYLIAIPIFVLGIIIGVTAQSNLNPFPDVPSDHWAYNAVIEISGEGIIKGYSDGDFKGDRNLTRYEAALMMCRTLKVAQGSNPGGCENAEPGIELPYCNSAPIDDHYQLATAYLSQDYPDFTVDKQSAIETGPCNNGNTASSTFDVLNGDAVIGQIEVNGDTEVITLSELDVSYEYKVCQTNEISLLTEAKASEYISNVSPSFFPNDYSERIAEDEDSNYNQGFFVLTDCLENGNPEKVRFIGHISDIFGDFLIKGYAGNTLIKNNQSKLQESNNFQVQFRHSDSDQIIDWEENAISFPGLGTDKNEYYASLDGSLILESELKPDLLTGEIILVLVAADSEGNIQQRYTGQIYQYGNHNWN